MLSSLNLASRDFAMVSFPTPGKPLRRRMHGDGQGRLRLCMVLLGESWRDIFEGFGGLIAE